MRERKKDIRGGGEGVTERVGGLRATVGTHQTCTVAMCPTVCVCVRERESPYTFECATVHLLLYVTHSRYTSTGKGSRKKSK